MEIPTIHPRPPQSYTCLGQEKHQMLDLNRRLESYLGRVKFLEEENQLLHEEILMLQKNREPQAQQRRALEAALLEAREELERAWREKDTVEVQLGNLSEELQTVGLQRQKVAAARAEAQGRLAESRKDLEEECRAQIWLRDKVAQLENELHFQIQAHQDDVSTLKASVAQARPLQVVSLHTQTHTQAFCDLGQEYSQRAAQAWREASEAYQQQAERLEESLSQAKARLGQITQERRENQMKLQSLTKDLEAARTKKEMLERRAAQQKDRQSQEISQLQAQVEALEEEKNRLGAQIDDLIMESRALLQLKMSLGLEVATYRTLLDGESQRVNDPSRNKHNIQTVSSTDGFQILQELKQTCQKTILSSYTSRPSTSDTRSSLQHKPLLSTSTLSPPNCIPSAAPDHSLAVQKKKESRAEYWSTPYTDIKALNGKDSVDLFMPEEVCEEVTYAAALSVASGTPNTHAVGESFEVDMTEVMTGVKVQAVASDVHVPEDNVVCAEMAHSTTAAYDSGVLQDDSAQALDVHNTSTANEMTIADSCDTESEKTDDFSEWIQLQPEQGPQRRWPESDPVTDVERIEMAEEQKGVSVSDREEQKDVSGPGTLFSDLYVKEDTTELITKDSEHGKTTSNGYQDLEENNGIYEPEREINMRQSLSTDKMVDESDQIKALESMGQEKETVFEESKDNDLSQQEEVIEDNKVEEELWASEDTLFTDSEIMEGVQGERRTDTEQYHLPERSFEEDVVSVTHNNVSMNLEEDSLPTHQQQEQTSQSEEHSEQNEDFNEKEEVEERRDHSESEEKELDDSPNVSMSWRTDPGELDSYALDNTLADTRPLIRYKSDDTDVNTQASHMGISDSSDSEDDREAGTGHRGVIKSKRFDTMEDLSEEPEVEVMGEVGSSEPPHNAVTGDLSENQYMALQEDYGDADNDSMIADAVGKLDEERTEMADHLRSDGVEDDTERQNFEDPLREDKEGQQDIILIQMGKTENTQHFPPNTTQNFPEETVESLVNITQTEMFSEEETATDTVSQEGITDDLPKPEDPTTQSYPFVEQLAPTQNISGTLQEAAEIEIKPSEDSSTEETMDKLVASPPQTEQFFEEEVVTETISQEEITDDVPIPEDPITQSSLFDEPLALTQNVSGTLHEAAEIEIESSEDSCMEETMDKLVAAPPQTEQFFKEDVVTETISLEEITDDLPVPEDSTTQSYPFVEPLAPTQNISGTLHEAAEIEIKSSEDSCMEETMDKLVAAPPQTEQFFKEDVVTENISQEEISDDLPIPEDPTTQSSPYLEPLALTQNILGTLHDSQEMETKSSEDSCTGETMENLDNSLPQTEPFLKDVVTESVSQEESGVSSAFVEPFAQKTDTQSILCAKDVVTESVSQEESGESSAFVEPFAQKTETQSILCASHEAAEIEIKPSIHNSLENTNEEDWQDLSMLTHVDATDNLSLSSEPATRPDSQAQASNYADDDHNDDDNDESHSSEEESPNASQCPSPGACAKPPKAHLAHEEASENLSGVPFDVPLGFSESLTQQGPLHEDEWDVLNASLKSQGTDNLKESESFNPFEDNDSLSRNTYAKQMSEHVDIFQGDKIDEPPKSNGKDTLHNFFSANMEDDDFWGSSQQMAATFDPEEINQEQYQKVTFQTSQSLRFEEAWGSPRAHQGPNGRAEKTTLLSSVPLMGMEEGPSQIKTMLGRQGEQVVAKQSDDSADEGDSWSSGEE